MKLQDWLATLETYATQGLPPGLERVRNVAERLQVLPVPYRVITVTGTNGKGSTTTACEYMLHAHGYRVGAFTSPHLLRFNERIRINTKEIEDDTLVAAFEAVAAAQQEIILNYFEFTLLAALWWFQRSQLDFAVLEVGIGGRLDAVNIVDADIAVITNIGLDHQATLGNTHEQIAREKAGIMRSRCPVVLGDPNMPMVIHDYADTIGAPLYQVNNHYQYAVAQQGWHFKSKDHHWLSLPFPSISLCNAALALMTLQLLAIPLQLPAIQQGLQSLQMPGRIQTIKKHCTMILDVSHNVESMQHLANYLQQQPCGGKTRVVFSCLSDKNIPGMMAALGAQVVWYLAPLSCSRAASLHSMQAAVKNLNVHLYGSVIDAYRAAMEMASAEDRVVVCGSFYTVSIVMRSLNEM